MSRHYTYQRLYKAARDGNIDELKEAFFFLSVDQIATKMLCMDKTAIEIACYHRQECAVQYLLSKLFSYEKNKNNDNLLSEYLLERSLQKLVEICHDNNDPDTIKHILKNVNHLDMYSKYAKQFSQTKLLKMVGLGHLVVVQHFLEHREITPQLVSVIIQAALGSGHFNLEDLGEQFISDPGYKEWSSQQLDIAKAVISGSTELFNSVVEKGENSNWFDEKLNWPKLGQTHGTKAIPDYFCVIPPHIEGYDYDLVQLAAVHGDSNYFMNIFEKAVKCGADETAFAERCFDVALCRGKMAVVCVLFDLIDSHYSDKWEKRFNKAAANGQIESMMFILDHFRPQLGILTYGMVMKIINLAIKNNDIEKLTALFHSYPELRYSNPVEINFNQSSITGEMLDILLEFIPYISFNHLEPTRVHGGYNVVILEKLSVYVFHQKNDGKDWCKLKSDLVFHVHPQSLEEYETTEPALWNSWLQRPIALLDYLDSSYSFDSGRFLFPLTWKDFCDKLEMLSGIELNFPEMKNALHKANTDMKNFTVWKLFMLGINLEGLDEMSVQWNRSVLDSGVELGDISDTVPSLKMLSRRVIRIACRKSGVRMGNRDRVLSLHECIPRQLVRYLLYEDVKIKPEHSELRLDLMDGSCAADVDYEDDDYDYHDYDSDEYWYHDDYSGHSWEDDSDYRDYYDPYW